MRHPDDKHPCPLLKRDVLWGECWVIQDIRDDNTDMEFARSLLNDPPQIKSVRNAGGIGWTKKHHDNFTPLIKQLSA